MHYQYVGDFSQSFKGSKFAITGFTLRSIKKSVGYLKWSVVSITMIAITVTSYINFVMQNNSIYDASNYLLDTWRRYRDDGEELCSYGIALAAYALASSPAAASDLPQQMLMELKSRIQQKTGKLNKAM